MAFDLSRIPAMLDYHAKLEEARLAAVRRLLNLEDPLGMGARAQYRPFDYNDERPIPAAVREMTEYPLDLLEFRVLENCREQRRQAKNVLTSFEYYALLAPILAQEPRRLLLKKRVHAT